MHQFERSAASHACGVLRLLSSRIDEFVADHGRKPLAIHMTSGFAIAMADALLDKGIPREPFPGTVLTIDRGEYDNIPMFRCVDPRCHLGDEFLVDEKARTTEPI